MHGRTATEGSEHATVSALGIAGGGGAAGTQQYDSESESEEEDDEQEEEDSDDDEEDAEEERLTQEARYVDSFRPSLLAISD